MAPDRKNGQQFLQHLDIEYQEEKDGPWLHVLVHVYLDKSKLIKLGAAAARNKVKRARAGPIECRAYLK